MSIKYLDQRCEKISHDIAAALTGFKLSPPGALQKQIALSRFQELGDTFALVKSVRTAKQLKRFVSKLRTVHLYNLKPGTLSESETAAISAELRRISIQCDGLEDRAALVNVVSASKIWAFLPQGAFQGARGVCRHFLAGDFEYLASDVAWLKFLESRQGTAIFVNPYKRKSVAIRELKKNVVSNKIIDDGAILFSDIETFNPKDPLLSDKRIKFVFILNDAYKRAAVNVKYSEHNLKCCDERLSESQDYLYSQKENLIRKNHLQELKKYRGKLEKLRKKIIKLKQLHDGMECFISVEIRAGDVNKDPTFIALNDYNFEQAPDDTVPDSDKGYVFIRHSLSCHGSRDHDDEYSVDERNPFWTYFCDIFDETAIRYKCQRKMKIPPPFSIIEKLEQSIEESITRPAYTAFNGTFDDLLHRVYAEKLYYTSLSDQDFDSAIRKILTAKKSQGYYFFFANVIKDHSINFNSSRKGNDGSYYPYEKATKIQERIQEIAAEIYQEPPTKKTKANRT